MSDQELAIALARVKNGNAHSAPKAFARDLSLDKEYWSARPFPKVLWHWTEAEFAAYLEQYRVPSNTLRDRESNRIHQIRTALVRGDYVPEEVMTDEATAVAVADAMMDLEANHCAAVKAKAQRESITAFERAIGYCSSEAEYQHRIRALLAQAAIAEGRSANGVGVTRIKSLIKEVAVDGLPYALTVSLRTPNEYSSHSERKFWLEIRDGRYNDVSLYGEVARIPFVLAEGYYRQLLDDKVITLTQSRTVLGEGWRPWIVVATDKVA